MTLFPQLSDTYYVENDKDILKLMDYTYAKNITINQAYWNEADTDSRFVANDQAVFGSIYGNLPNFRRNQFTFNRLLRIRNMISGYQRQHRKSTIATPIESKDQKGADQFTKLLYHVNGQGRVLETISDAFQGAVTTGMNLLNVWIDYRGDPVNGDIKVDNLPYNAYLIDPYFKKMDLSDCNSVWTRKYISREQAITLVPGRDDEIKEMRGYGNRDGKFQFLPESYNYGVADLLTYDEYWYLDSRRQTVLLDSKTGETFEWRGSDEDKRQFLSVYPEIISTTQLIPTVKLAIVVQGRVMYNGPNPLGLDCYPQVPVWCYYYPEIPYFPLRVQGVIRSLRDSQYLYNRRKNIELDILESQVNSGFIFRENALVNPKDVFLSGQGRGIPLKDSDKPIGDLIQPIQAPQIPPSMMQLSELLSREISEISGVNEELLGSSQDSKVGIIEMLRQGAALTTLQIPFDNLDQAQRLLGNICIRLIQENWTPGKVVRILNEEPTEQFYNRSFTKYDAVVEEGLNTSTQRGYQFSQLLQLREMGIPVPMNLLIETSTLQNKQELIDGIQQQEQQQSQMAQQQAQMQIEVLKAQIGDLKSRATANEGLGLERVSRVQENRALAIERIAEAQKDRDLGTLDRIKAIKELTTIDLAQLEQAVGILKALQEGQHAEADQQRAMAAPTDAATSKMSPAGSP